MSEDTNTTLQTDNQENKIVMGSRANEIVHCYGCNKEITVGERHSFQGENGEDIYFCSECMEKINSELDAETKNPNMFGALALGILAGIIGAIAWFAITIMTKATIGYIALGLGWLIGVAVSFGAGRKKGIKLQILSALIMTIFLLISEFMIFLYFVSKVPEINASVFELLLDILFGGQFFAAVGSFLQHSVSPVGLLIWGIGIYTAYIIPKASKL